MKNLVPKDRKVPVKINFEFSLFSFVRRFVGIAVIVILAYLYWGEKAKNEELINLNESIASEIEVWKDKDGLSNAKILALETEKASDFINLVSKDEQIIALQRDVKKYKKNLKKQGSVTNITTETVYDTTKVGNDKLYKEFFGSFVTDSISNKWIDTRFGFTFKEVPGGFKIDTTSFSLKLRNEYTVIIGREKTGFLGMGKSNTFAQVVNKNPYSTTTELRTYQVTLPKKKRWMVGPTVGVQWDGEFKPYIGIGVGYTLFNF